MNLTQITVGAYTVNATPSVTTALADPSGAYIATKIEEGLDAGITNFTFTAGEGIVTVKQVGEDIVVTSTVNAEKLLTEPKLVTGKCPSVCICGPVEVTLSDDQLPLQVEVTNFPDQIDIEKSGYICKDGTHQYEVCVFINGIKDEAQSMFVDSGIACDEPQPVPPVIDKEYPCLENADGTFTQHEVTCSYQFDPADLTAEPIKTVLSDVDTGTPCNKPTILPPIITEVPRCEAGKIVVDIIKTNYLPSNVWADENVPELDTASETVIKTYATDEVCNLDYESEVICKDNVPTLIVTVTDTMAETTEVVEEIALEGECDKYVDVETREYCDLVTETLHTIVSTYDDAGTETVVTTEDLGIDCVSDTVSKDFEFICNPTTNFYDLYEWTVVNGVSGVPTITPTTYACDEPLPDYEIRTICDETTETEHEQLVVIVDGVETPIGTSVDTLKECNKDCGQCACWKDKFIEGGLDNTFTSYTHTNQVFSVTFDNGDVDTFGVASATGWTDQVQQMATGLGGIMPWAQTVDPFCNLPGGCGGLLGPAVVLNQMFARYVGFRVCPGEKVPVKIEYTSDQKTTPVNLVVQYVETDTIYYDRCRDCDGNITYTYAEDGPTYSAGDVATPVCAIPCEDAFAETPLAECQTTYLDGCDNVNSTDVNDFVNIVRAITECGSGPMVAYLQEDADGALVEYTLIGDFVDCATGEIIELPEECDNLTPLGLCKCYGAGIGDSSHTNTDNNTDADFSIGGTGTTLIKWNVQATDNEDADTFTADVAACINAGNTANLTITDVSGNVYTFPATGIDTAGNADGTGNWLFSGPGAPASGSGKVLSATMTCGAEASGEACAFRKCDSEEIVWIDSITGAELTAEQIETLEDCTPVEDCEITDFQTVLCAAEAITDSNAGAIAVGDQILTIGKKDCENNVVSSKSYLLTNNEEVVDAILTDTCDPEPQVEQVKECIKDIDGDQWTQIIVVDNADPQNPVVVAEFFYDSNLEIGTPSGEPSEWTSCEECEGTPECVESQEWTYGLDNTGTNFTDTATYVMTLSDGSTLEIEQTPTGGWTQQNQLLTTLWQAEADAAGLAWFIEPRAVNNLNPTDISGNYGSTPTGLPGAPSVPVATFLIDNGIVARYLNIQICPGQPVPVSVVRTESALYTNNPYTLTTAGAILGPIQKFQVCRCCGEEPVWYLSDGVTLASAGQIPKCYEPCGTLSLVSAPPDRDCTFEIDVACDNNNSTNTVDFTNTITRRATVCNGEQIGVDYFQADPTDASALIAYTLVGDFVDCATGEVIDLPTQEGVVIDCSGTERPESFDLDVRVVGSKNPIEVFQECELINYYTIDNGGLDGLRNREWHDTAPVTSISSPTPTEDGAAIRESHDFSLPTTTDTITTDWDLNDTNNTAAELDIQVKDGYVIATEQMLVKYSGASEGYWAVELGQCCVELELIAENGGFFTGREMVFTIPKGIHQLRIWNIDSGGSNSDANLSYSEDGGITWIATNTPPNLKLSQVKPSQECLQGYLCCGEYFELDKVTPLTDFSLCKLECTAKEYVAPNKFESVSETEVCADGKPAIRKMTLDSEGVEVITFLGEDGVEFTPVSWKAGSCTKSSECIKWRNKYIGIDNTGSAFNQDETIEIFDIDGNSVGTFVATASGDNTVQLNKWIDGLQTFYPNALIEQRYAPSGGAGLPAPTSDANFTQMAARYVQFTACDGDELPYTLRIIERGGNPVNILMDTEVVIGEEQRGYICYECGQEPVLFYSNGDIIPEFEIPPCYVTCAEGFVDNIDSVPKPDQQHVIVSGTGNVPAGLKSVTINNITGTTTTNTGFQLGTGRRVDAISYNATELDGARGLLPAITLSGGTWQWTGIQPIIEE